MAVRAGGRFALRLGAVDREITFLGPGFHGGDVSAEVVSEHDPALHFAKKHPGPPAYEPLVLPVGMSLAPALFQWIAGSWGPDPQKHDGSVLILDYDLGTKREIAFAGALIAETVIPALDSSSKNAGHVVIRAQPETSATKPGTGKLSVAALKQKLWRTSAFRLQIDGLDCQKVRRIESFTVGRPVTPVADESDATTLAAGPVTFPTPRITLPQSAAATWFDWHHDFIVNGNNAESFERDGTLSFLAANLQDELTRIDLHHLGILRVATVPGSGADQVATVVADLYCEEMVLSQP